MLALVAVLGAGLATAAAAGSDPAAGSGGSGSPLDADRHAEAAAERALRAAERRAAVRDPGAIDAYEAIGATAPVTRWSGDAWVRAARLAEQAGEFARARRDLARAIAVGGDPRRVERARGDLARLTGDTGGGRWDQVAAEHDRLASQLRAGGDPAPALARLEALVIGNPGYPRAIAAEIAIAQAWERDGDPERAIAWLDARRAERRRRSETGSAGAAGMPDDQGDARLAVALIRALTRRGELERARGELTAYRMRRGADRALAGALDAALTTAQHRGWLRGGLWGLVIALAGLAVAALVHQAGSARAALRRLARPPTEAVFLIPVGGVLIGVAATGNPMVARAVRQVVVAGLAIAWLSGAALDARRRAPGANGSVAGWLAVVHAAASVAAVAALAYLALDRDHMLDLIGETWRNGPAPR